MVIERRLSAHIDWPLIAAVLILTFVGLATIYSVTWDVTETSQGPVLAAGVPSPSRSSRWRRASSSTTGHSRESSCFMALSCPALVYLLLRPSATARGAGFRRGYAPAVGIRPDGRGPGPSHVLRETRRSAKSMGG